MSEAVPAETPGSGDQPRRRRIRLVLLGGFGGLLALMLLAGLDALTTLRRLHAQEEQTRRAFMEKSQSVSRIRVSIRSYTDAFESYLSNGDTPSPKQLAKLAVDVEQAVGSFPHQRAPQEQALLQALSRFLTDQRGFVQSIEVWTEADRKSQGPRLLVERVRPANVKLTDTVQEITLCVNDRMTEASRQMDADYGTLQSRLNFLLLVTLGSGLLLSLASAAYILRLQRETDARYQDLARNRLELRDLSARLVDAQENERRAISRELHDEIGQSLGTVLIDLGRLMARIPESDTQTREQVGHIRKVAESAVQSVRNIALLLRPAMLDDLGLVPALEWLAREFSRHGEMDVDIQADDIPDNLPDDYNTCIYRLVQEALNNAARHAHSKSAHVKVARAHGRISIVVTDQGKGFDSAKTRGMGLLGMQERVKRLGGTLTLDSKPGEGTIVMAELPAPPPAGASANV